MEHYLKPNDAAAVLGMSPKTLANWRAALFGPPFTRVGNRIRYSERDLIEWVESQKVIPPCAPKPAHGRIFPSPRSIRRGRLGRHKTMVERRVP